MRNLKRKACDWKGLNSVHEKSKYLTIITVILQTLDNLALQTQPV